MKLITIFTIVLVLLLNTSFQNPIGLSSRRDLPSRQRVNSSHTRPSTRTERPNRNYFHSSPSKLSQSFPSYNSRSNPSPFSQNHSYQPSGFSLRDRLSQSFNHNSNNERLNLERRFQNRRREERRGSFGGCTTDGQNKCMKNGGRYSSCIAPCYPKVGSRTEGSNNYSIRNPPRSLNRSYPRNDSYLRSSAIDNYRQQLSRNVRRQPIRNSLSSVSRNVPRTTRYSNNRQYYYTPSTPRHIYVRPYYHNNVYYPYYTFYMYYYNDFRSHFPWYYSYYSHYSYPHVHYYGPLLLRSGRYFHFNNLLNSNYGTVSRNLRQCKYGPQYYFTVRVNGKVYRVFLGDVNDFFNVQCLYMMTAIVSIGEIDHSNKVYEIFNNPSKTLELSGRQIDLNPFQNSQYIPENVDLREINDNTKVLSFSLSGSDLPEKEIYFYHREDLEDYEDIFRELSQDAPAGNVLFVVDQLQRRSVNVFKQFLVRYKRYTPAHIHRIRYKSVYLFPRHIYA